MKKIIENTNSKKFKLILVLSVIVLFVCTFLPTYGRYKNRTSYYELTEWDGSIATSYRSGSGTEVDPYIISNGSEFAYFAEQLKHTNYEGIYFELGNDIVLNKGTFEYDGTINYTVDETIYQIEEYTNNYEGGYVNEISPLGTHSGFKGNLNGNAYRIYGLFMTTEESKDLALFENISGNITDLYISNALIFGGNNTSMLALEATDANIKNVMIDGYVIGSGENKITKYNLEDISEGNEIEITNKTYPGTYISSTLKGKFNPTDETNILKINDKEIEKGEFSIELTNTENITYTLSKESEYTLTNLTYEITSDYGVASSFAIESNNSTYENVVNKANIYAKNYASGFIHSSTGKLTINNAYNKAIIDSNNTSGFISYINSGIIELNSIYNNGTLSNNLASIALKINSGDVNLSNSFVTSEDYVINEIQDANVTIENCYALNRENVKNGNITGEFKVTNETTLKSEKFITEDIKFNKFNSITDVLENEENIWVIEKDSYPILYIDDLNRPTATINSSIYSWNTYTDVLDTHKFSNEFKFSINKTDVLANIKKIEYYIHKSNEVVENIENVDWKTYTEIVSVNEIGNYIIYAKITDDNDEVTYINSDILVINEENIIANITLNEYKWSSLTTIPKTVYLSTSSKLKLNFKEEYVDKENISYYVTSELLTEEKLKELNEVWNNYTEEINITSNENNIYYFKIIDKNGNTLYISTDYITVDGYTMKDIVVGRKVQNDNPTITNNSSITLKYEYRDENLFLDGYNHNIISNTLLPENTQITLIDNINNKVYKYKTTSDKYGYNETTKKATYQLKSFNEIGTLDTKLLNESTYHGTITEDFSIIIDFKNTKITTDIENVEIAMEVNDNNGKSVIPTLENSIKTFNVSTNEQTLQLISNFTGYIEYNNDNSNKIDFQIKLENDSIIDSTINDKKYGLEIKMLDNDKKITLDKSYLSNIQFKYNDKVYMPYSNGIVNINLNDITTGNIIIDTYVNDKKIEGNYSFNICPYVSYDGLNYNNKITDKCIDIQLNIIDNYKDKYKFDIQINASDRIFIKNKDKTLNFEMLYLGELENPNIKVSLYEKKDKTAYDQTFTLVDLGKYIYNDIEKTDNNVYSFIDLISSSSKYEMYSLSFKNSNFKLNGYKIVFDLYDGNKKVSSIEKKILIKGEE